MDFNIFKAAIIKRSRSVTEIDGKRLVIYPEMTFIKPDGKSALYRSIMVSEYINNAIELKKPYYIFMMPITIPVIFIQSGFFIARKTQCVFAIYDGKDMRQDVKNTLSLVMGYRRTVLFAAFGIIVFSLFFGISFGGLTLFIAIILTAWFTLVFIFALILKIDQVEDDMMDAVDLDRLRLDKLDGSAQRPPDPQAS